MVALPKRTSAWIWSALLIVAVVCVSGWFFLRDEGEDSGTAAHANSESVPAKPLPEMTPPPRPDPIQDATGPDRDQGVAVKVEIPAGAPEAVKAFREWAGSYFAAAPAQRAGLEARGAELAREHTKAIASLIKTDPRRAIENAVSMVVRQDLPGAVVAQLEERVSVKAAFEVLGAVPDPSRAAEDQAPPIIRRVITEDGRRWRAYTYGRRMKQGTRSASSLNGVAVGKDFAISDSPLRVLEVGERPNADGREVVNQCPVSGIVTVVERKEKESLPPVTPSTPAFETPGRIVYVCSGGHISNVQEQMETEESAEHWESQGVTAAAGGGSGPAVAPFSVPTTWTTGHRRMLYMHITFPDHRVDPQSEADCHNALRQMNDFVVQASYGRCYFTYTVTPLIVLPYSESWYIRHEDDTQGGGDDLIVNHARTIARAMGYDTTQYDFDVSRWNGYVGPYGGLAFIGAKGIRLKTNSVGTLCHELGHNLGVWHANFWETAPPSVIGPGQNLEYGNLFDVMGSSGASIMGHFTAPFKNQIGWLPQETFWTAHTSGTYRIHQFDTGSSSPDQRHALRIRKDAERNYWFEFRQRHTNNTALSNGLMATWDDWGIGGLGSFGGYTPYGSDAGAHLLDMTPGSFGNGISDTRNDAALYVGRTHSDPDAGVHVTPVFKDTGTTPPTMDVVVNLGDFPGNQNPTLSINAGSTTANVGAPVILTAAASDPDPDQLAYAWNFDDGTYSTTNSPNQVKSWSSPGHYRVQCTVSDMKGGRVTRGVTITVGSPTTYVVSGIITGPGGLPVEGVYVGNYAPTNTATHPNASSFRGTWTESDGAYYLTRNTAGSRTISPHLYPYTFAPSGFTNPLNITGHATGINFTGAQLPTITITAPDDTATEAAPVTSGTIRITRSGSTASSLAVQVFDDSSGNAIRNSDYTLSPAPTAVSGGSGASQFTIPAGAAFLDITVNPITDGQIEGVENAVLDFANTAAGYVISGSTTGVVSITDDETSVPVVRLSVVDADASETGPDTATLRLERTGSTALGLAVNLTYAGDATFNSDYTANTTVTIPASSASTTFTITPVNDPAQESTEAILVTIATSPGVYQRDSSSTSQTVLLIDNDSPTVTIGATDSSAAEGGLDHGLFTITRAGGDLTQPLVVDYALAGRAVHGSDYLRLDGRAVIPANATSAGIVIQPVDDALDEGIQDVICQIRTSTTYFTGAPSQATINITDNDGSQVYVRLLSSASLEPVSGTSTVLQFEVARPAAGAAITVNYTVGGTATPGADYTVLPGTVSFSAAQTTATISVSGMADALMENAESVTLTLQSGVGYSVFPAPDSAATGFITDRGQPTVDVSVADTGSTLTTAGTEGSTSLRFIISRRVSSPAPLIVDYTMAGTATQGVDYAATSGTATILADDTSVFVPISTINDSLAEGVESIILNITPQSGTYGLGASSATMMLGDNDPYSGLSVGFATSTSTVDESAGTVPVQVNFSSLSGGATVRYRASAGTATGNGKDYTLAEGTLSFAAGQSSRTISLVIHPDGVPEPAETVTLQLFNAVGASLVGGTHTVTINNLSVPESWTDPASFVLLTSATLNGHVIPNGLATDSWFEYGGSTAYGSTTPPQSVGNGRNSVNVSESISGLTLSGYHFRLVSQNSAGTTYGADQIFGVDATPAVTTLAATSITGSTATLNGTVNANNEASTVSFEYGPTPSYGTTVAATPSVVNGTSSTAVNAPITGLIPGSTYHCRVRATNNAGTSLGNDMTFTTSNSNPVANFVNAPTSATTRYPVTYSATGSDPDGDTLTYSWDFGAAYPVQMGASIVQTFLTGGTVNLTLTVSDGHGGTAVLLRTITVTDPLRAWTRMTSGTTSTLNAICTNGTDLVAVGNNGRILSSPNGTDWTIDSVPSGSNVYFRGVSWNGQRFIAVGEDYDFTLGSWVGVAYTSPYASDWDRVTMPNGTSSLNAVASSAAVTVAVGDDGTLMRTSSGNSWNTITLPGLAANEDIVGAAYQGGVFAITGWSSGTMKVMTSTNGTSWTDHTPGSGLQSWQDMRYIAGLNGRFVGSGWYSRVRTSTDGGQTFSTTRTIDESTPALAYGDGVYFAGGVNLSTGADVDLISIDAQTWFSGAAPTTAQRNGAAFMNHRFYTVGTFGEIWRSGDTQAPPSIITQPVGLVVLQGDSVQFSVLATGSSPISYSWRKNGAVIPGATGSTYSIPSAQEAHEAVYTVVVSNPLGAVLSAPANLVVNSPVQIVSPPVGGSILEGQTKIFSVTATGDAPITYQWKKDGVVMDGKTASTLTLTDVHAVDSGFYECALANPFGTANTTPVLLNVQDKFLAVGAPTFTVEEGVPGGVFQLPVVRTGDPNGTVTATLTITNGTAKQGSDFTPATMPVTVGDGVDHVDIPIDILNPPGTPEANETFTVTLGSPSLGTAIISPASATVVIVDTSALSPAQDTVAPGAPVITTPAANAKISVNTGATYNVSGTASDNKGVFRVQVSLNGGAFVNASLGLPGATSTTYSLPVVPATGLNTIQVKVIDYAARESAISTRSFTTLRPLDVEVDTALGSVTSGFAPSSFREVGKSLTIAATPKAPTTTPAFSGAIFTGWSLGGQDVVNGNVAFTPQRLGLVDSALAKNSLSFIFREGLILTANFIANPYTPLAGTYNGLIRPSGTLPDRAPLGGAPGAEDGTPPTNATEGSFTATVMNTGAFSGKLTIDGTVLAFAGSFDDNGDARFGTARLRTLAVARTNKPSYLVALHVNLAENQADSNAEDRITGTITVTDFKQSVIASVSEVDGDRAYYNGTSLVVPAAYLGAASANGMFTGFLPPKAQNPALAVKDSPQGHGIVTITVAKSGVVTVAGTAADGSVLSASSTLSQANDFPLFAQLYNKLGFVSGYVQLNVQADSDMLATDLQWLRPFQGTSHYYAFGWPGGIKVDLMAAKYVVTAGQSVMKAPGGIPLAGVLPNGNVLLNLTEGQLSEALIKAVNLSPADAVTRVPVNDPTFTLTVNRATGVVSGIFDHTDDTKPAYKAIIYQKGTNAGAYGHFLTKQPVPINFTGESGGVTLIGQP